MLLRQVELAPVDVEPAELTVRDGQARLVVPGLLVAQGVVVKLPGDGEVSLGGVHHAQRVQHPAGQEVVPAKEGQGPVQLRQGLLGFAQVQPGGAARVGDGGRQDGVRAVALGLRPLEEALGAGVVAVAHQERGLARQRPATQGRALG